MVDANGRGAANLTIPSAMNLSNFVFYVVSAGELLVMESDPQRIANIPAISGLALQQSGGPFAPSSLNSTTVFNLAGPSESGNNVAVGLMTFGGDGSISGRVDENDAGIVTSDTAFTGNYTVDASALGRGVIAIAGDPMSKPFYLVSPNSGFIINTGAQVQSGNFELQNGGLFSDASFSGNYILGSVQSPLNSLLSPITGVAIVNGSGNLGGTSDAATETQAFTGSYSVATNGRTVLAITPNLGPSLNMVFYVISPSKASGIQADPGAADAMVVSIEK